MELIIIRWELLILLFQDHELLRLGARYWWRASNGWDTTGRPSCWRGRRPDFFRVHQTIPPPSTNPYWNLDGSKDCPHISPSTGYYRSPEFFFLKSSYSIQENNNLQNKMNEQTYHEVLSTVVHELLHPLLAVLTPHMRFYKQLHWTRLTSKRHSL